MLKKNHIPCFLNLFLCYLLLHVLENNKYSVYKFTGIMKTCPGGPGMPTVPVSPSLPDSPLSPGYPGGPGGPTYPLGPVGPLMPL